MKYLKTAILVYFVIILGVCGYFSVARYFPNVEDKTQELKQLKEDYKDMIEVIDQLSMSKQEVVYTLEAQSVQSYTHWVEYIRLDNKVDDGHTATDVVVALSRSYNEFNLAARGMTMDDWLGQADVESNFNCSAISYAGAVGVVQLMPNTAAWLNEKYFHISGFTRQTIQDPVVKEKFEHLLKDPVVNTRFGAKYMQILLDQYKNKGVALEAYNKGPNEKAVTRTDYQKKVLIASRSYSNWYAKQRERIVKEGK